MGVVYFGDYKIRLSETITNTNTIGFRFSLINIPVLVIINVFS